MNLFCDSKMDDAKRREELYRGSLFVYSPSPGALEFCDFARELIAAAFRPYDPRYVHESMPVERCVEILADLKPRFIHHPQSKELIRGMLAERGCELEKTYFDVPRLRTAFPADYLSSGIAYAFHPHRDTWYSAPFSQINWWMPVYEICPDNSMAFHPRYWDSKRSPTTPTPITTTNGIARVGRVRRNTSRRIRGCNRAPRSLWNPTRKCAWWPMWEA